MGFFRGTPDSDVVFAGGGDDTLYGEGGSDTLYSNGGNDRVYGGAEVDWIRGGAGNDILWGGGDEDWMSGDAGDDTLYGGDGQDWLVASLGNDHYFGGANGDTLSFADLAGTARITVNLTLGIYQIGTTYSGKVKEIEYVTLRGGNDVVIANDTQNYLEGLGGNDSLAGMGERDNLFGGDGNDTLDGGSGNDQLEGGAGIDTAIFSASADMLVNLGASSARGEGFDRLRGIENVQTSAGHDTIYGNNLDNMLTSANGNDLLKGGRGNDTLKGGAGADTLDGGEGADRMNGGNGNDIYYVNDGKDVIVETATGGIDRINTTISIDLNGRDGAFLYTEELVLRGSADLSGFGNDANNYLSGNSGANVLSGRDGNDLLSGGAGNDSLRGGNGNDRLLGGAGNDLLTGGSGSDSFEFNGQFGRDRITDFQDNLDSIRLLNLGVSSFAQARSHATQVGEDVVFNFGNGNVLTVEHTTINALSNDLIFV